MTRLTSRQSRYDDKRLNSGPTDNSTDLALAIATETERVTINQPVGIAQGGLMLG
jgi:hypothetical protein